MAGYIIADVQVHEPEEYEEYRRQVMPTLERYGGRFLVRGGKTETLEGEWTPGRLVVIEFESAERAKEWWASAEYERPKALRQRLSTTNMIMAEGA